MLAGPAGVLIKSIRAFHVGQGLDRLLRDREAETGLKKRSLRPGGRLISEQSVRFILNCTSSAFPVDGKKRNYRKMFSRFGLAWSEFSNFRDDSALDQNSSVNLLVIRFTQPGPRTAPAPPVGPPKNPPMCLAPISLS